MVLPLIPQQPKKHLQHSTSPADFLPGKVTKETQIYLLRNTRRKIKMKNFIVVIALLILGVFIFGLIMGDEDTSLKSASRDLMQSQVAALGD